MDKSMNINDLTTNQAQAVVNRKRKEEEARAGSRFPVKSLFGAGALGATGAGAYYAGKKMDDFGNISFEDIQNYINSKAPKQDPNFLNDPKYQSFMPKAKLKDYIEPDWNIIDKSIKSTYEAPDSLRGVLGYGDTGSRMLAGKMYGDNSGFDLVKWFRSPANEWWRKEVPDQGGPFEKFPTDTFVPSWNDSGPINMHYKGFSKGVIPAFKQLTYEHKGALDELIQRLAEARKRNIIELASNKIPAPEALNFYSQAMGKDLGEWNSPDRMDDLKFITDNPSATPIGLLKSLLAGTKASPLVRDKVVNTGTILANSMEKNLPPEKQLAALLGMDLNALAKRDYKSDILQGAAGIDSTNWTPEQINQQLYSSIDNKVFNTAEGAIKGITDPTAQAEAIHAALKDEPLAQLIALAPNKNIPYPLASTMYNGLQRGISLPGRLAKAFEKLSPVTKGVGLGLGAAGAGVGLYALRNWLNNKKKLNQIEKQKQLM